jgi:2-oxoglutarate/2-oxoacid ferredoxin oxidoreductase subunit beta
MKTSEGKDFMSALEESVLDNETIIEKYLRMDRLPHIWCSGCGIGTALRSTIDGLIELNIPQEELAVVSGIGCTARVAGYLKLDSFHTTHGRSIPFATGLKLANPKMKVFVFSGDGDLFAIGGNHLIHAARRNMDIKVICVNNFIYGMTGGQVGCTTPTHSKTSTSPYGNYEPPFNLCYLTAAAGAVYVARWTTFHVRQIKRSVVEAFNKRGFSFIEIISPCPTVFGSRNGFPTGLDMMKFFKANSQTVVGADPRDVGIDMGDKIKVGKFVDTERPSFQDRLSEMWDDMGGEDARIVEAE